MFSDCANQRWASTQGLPTQHEPRLQRAGQAFAVVVGDVAQRGAEQVNHTGLDEGVGPDGSDRIR